MRNLIKISTSLTSIGILALGVSHSSWAFENLDSIAAPVPVSSYVNDDSPIIEDFTEPSFQDNIDYLQEKETANEQQEGDDGDSEFIRIQKFTDASAVGKIVIVVHKNEDTRKAEYLEVFHQKTEEPSSLEAIPLFDGGKSNRALVSTAGTFHGKKYVTPTGDFAIDSLEVMHHSKTYFDAPMPWTMFFNQGIAIHAATGSEIRALGRPASHGCVRVHPANAKLLFDLVKVNGRSSAVIELLKS